jgi:hypothetical protein
MKKLKAGMEVQITLTARILELDRTGDNARLNIYAEASQQWFDTAYLEPLEEVMEKRRQSKGIFEAANAIDGGKLPRRKDAVEYIRYLQETLHVLGGFILERERELEALGWKRPEWNIAALGVTFTLANSPPHSTV